jgi:hypothetical protein
MNKGRIGDPIDWLLEPTDPTIRYLTLRYLLGRSEDAPDVRQAHAAVAHSPVIERIFSRQAPGGFWGDAASPYLPKYKAAYWTVMVLGYLRASRGDERVRSAVEHLFCFQQPIGGFAEMGEERARREYRLRLDKAQRRGKASLDEAGFIADRTRQATLSCLTGNVVAALLRLGHGDDPRLWKAVDWLVRVQNADGGWLCPYWKAHIRDTHSCFYGTICPLEAFAEIPAVKRSSKVKTAIDRAAEFLLMHRLYKADHHNFQVINPRWLKLSFPWFYGYDVLRGLWVLTKLGVRDARMADAIAVLQEKCTPEGKWILESTPTGRMQADLEKKGQPSRWLTLYGRWVLSAWRGER